MTIRKVAVLLFCAVAGPAVSASELTELELLRQELSEIRQAYESRIDALEVRIRSLESPTQAPVPNAASPAASAIQEKPNDFNPSMGVVLVGTATDFSPDDDFTVPGYMVDEEAGPGENGFSIGESELNVRANIDDRFFGNLTLAIADEDGATEVELEEAWFETLTLSHGLQLRGGRFFSGIGYRNQFHRHADDFVDRPLPYACISERPVHRRRCPGALAGTDGPVSGVRCGVDTRCRISRGWCRPGWQGGMEPVRPRGRRCWQQPQLAGRSIVVVGTRVGAGIR